MRIPFPLRFTMTLLFAFLGVAMLQRVEACRYNIRDVGFVDLGRSAYRLELPIAGAAPGAAPGTIEAAEAQLASMKADFPPGIIHWTLASDSQAGFALLHAPNQRSRRLLEGSDLANATANTWHQACITPLSQSFVDQLIDSYCLLLLVEGDDPRANKRAKASIAEAIEQVVATRSLWPKPIDHPPTLALLPFTNRETESTLLWSLEVDEKSTDPQVVLLFGRGRRLGRILTGDDLSTATLARQLGILSVDCECDFNVASLIGPMIPHDWTAEHETRASQSLGFDPGMPLVEVEVEQILARWPQVGEDGSTGQAPSFGDPMLGYQEIELPTGDIDVASPESPIAESPPSLPSPKQAPESHEKLQKKDAPANSPALLIGSVLAGLLVLSLVGSGIVWLLRKP